MNKENGNGQVLLGRFSGGSFKEQLEAAAVTLSDGRCTLRGCPYPAAEGAIVCSYHQQFFSYESYLFDRSIEDHYRNMEDQFTADGLVIQHRRRSQQSQEERLIGLYHQILGSAGMLADALKHLREASPAQIIDWSRNHFAAQELLESCRYPGKRIVCPYCGCLDVGRNQTGFTLRYRCKLCLRGWNLTARTIMNHRILTLDKWVHVLCILKDQQTFGVIAELSEKVQISSVAAGRMNHKFRLCGELVGLQIGWTGNADSGPRSELRVKLGLPATEQQPPDLMSIRETAAYHGRTSVQIAKWADGGLLKLIRFRRRRFFSREEVQKFQPPPRKKTTGSLVSAEPSRRMVRELREKGYSKAELKAELRCIHFGESVASGTEARIKAAYDRLIGAAKTPRLVPAAPTWEMINELHLQGHTLREIALAIGFHPDLKLGKQTVMSSTEAKIKELYERLRKPQTE
jgi:transposase-like protein